MSEAKQMNSSFETTKLLAKQIAKNLIDFADSLEDLGMERHSEPLEIIAPQPMQFDKPLMVEDIMEYLNCSKSAVYEIIRSKQLQSVKVAGKHVIKHEWLETYINSLANK